MLKIRSISILSAITLVAFAALAIEATAAQELEEGSLPVGAIESVEDSISATESEEAETTDEKAEDAAENEEAAEPVAFDLNNLHIYGYFSVRFEKVFSEPSIVDGETVKEDAPAETESAEAAEQ